MPNRQRPASTSGPTRLSVVFVCPRFHTNMTGWVRVLQESGHSVQVVADKSFSTEDHEILKPMPAQRFRRELRVPFRGRPKAASRPIGPSPVTILDPLRAISFLRGNSTDAVVLRATRSATTLVWALAVIATGRSLIIYTQGAVFRPDVGWASRISRRLLHRVLHVSWMSPVLRRVDGPPGDQLTRVPGMTFVPFVADTRYFRTISSPSLGETDPLKVVSVGKFQARKQLLETVRALDMVATTLQRPVQLTLIGQCLTDQEDSYRRRLVQEQVSELMSVTCAVNLGRPALADALAQSDLFVLLTTQELASIAQVEALAIGIPVVITSDNGTAHYVRPGCDGVVTAVDLHEVAGQLVELVAPSGALASMQRQARSFPRNERAAELFPLLVEALTRSDLAGLRRHEDEAISLFDPGVEPADAEPTRISETNGVRDPVR